MSAHLCLHVQSRAEEGQRAKSKGNLTSCDSARWGGAGQQFIDPTPPRLRRRGTGTFIDGAATPPRLRRGRSQIP
jgi:hypothetical protein